MRLSNIKVEQIYNENVIEDYGEILCNKELRSILNKFFGNLTVKENGCLYGKYRDKDYCIFYKNISYLGIPHPIYKKRLQIPSKFKKIYDENRSNNIVTLLLGVYKYKDNILICDFNTKTYINKKSHNSSAHVYSIDLINGERTGMFELQYLTRKMLKIILIKNYSMRIIQL